MSDGRHLLPHRSLTVDNLVHIMSMEQPTGLVALPALPFVGRTVEIERLVRFWRGTLEGEEMRGALLIGEAGIGKSRLVNELTPRIEADGGVVVHARLVPESATAIIPLLAQGLSYSGAARSLLRCEPEETLPSVTGALRRLARLRPTLIILEDLHLLAGDALRDLAMLLDALAEESLSLLATSRPVELPARPSLERVLVETIRLERLDEASVEQLWNRLFDGSSRPEIIAGLTSAAAGNPLALRSALRGLLRTGLLQRDPVTSEWSASLETEGFARALRTSVDLLAEGMAAHLAEDEREAAAALATLGEMFPPETAEMLLEERSHLMDALLVKGIIVRATTGLPMLATGRSAADPITFTHTLLHQHLVSSADVPAGRLVRLIASDAPLYSIVPFRLLASTGRLDHLPVDDLRRGIERVVVISFPLDSGPDWRLAGDVLAAGWRFLDGLEGRIAANDELGFRLTLLSRTLASQRRAIASEAYAERLDEMLALTAGELPGELVSFRLRALYHLHLRFAETTPERCGEVWLSVEELRARHPELTGTEIYLCYLDDVARASLRAPDVPMLRSVERRFEEVMATPDLPEEIRMAARRRVASMFLLMFDTEEELQRRMSLLDDLPAGIGGDDAVAMNRIALLETTGRMEEGLAAARTAMERFKSAGLPRNAAHCALIALCCRAALGAEIETIDREMDRLVSGAGYTSTPSFMRNVAIYLTEVALLRGEIGWTRRIQERLQPGTDLYWPQGEMLMKLEEGTLAAGLHQIELDEKMLPLGVLAGAVLGISAGDAAAEAVPEAACTAARELLERPLLRLEDLLTLHAALSLLGAGEAALDERTRDAAGRALADALDWTLERRLLPCAHALLARYRSLFGRREWERGSGRLKKLEERRSLGEVKIDRTRITVRMIGTITVTLPGGEPTSMRGFRMRKVLALLVGARMVTEPLSHRDFCRLAADGELDPDLARKNASMAVARLREVIGAEAVPVGEETYELDTARVEVDLLEAWTLIEMAGEALRRRSLARAVPALLRALEIAGGDVPFPGFYDEFFEALRDDFEYRLRRTAIDVARALLREADAAGAEALLRRTLHGLPGDEEIGALLRDAIQAGGLRADAAMIEMKVAG